jgi:hypothetical protein
LIETRVDAITEADHEVSSLLSHIRRYPSLMLEPVRFYDAAIPQKTFAAGFVTHAADKTQSVLCYGASVPPIDH